MKKHFAFSSGSRAVGLATLGAALFSAKAVIIKLAYQYEVDTLTLLLLRMGFALPFFVGIGIWKTRQQALEKKPTLTNWGQLILAGILGYYLASLLDFMGLQFVTASLERIILFVYPTMVVLLEWAVYRKSIHKMQALAIALTYVGMLIVYVPELRLSGQNDLFKGSMLIFLSALAFAVYLLLSQQLIKVYGGIRFTSYAMVVATACIIGQQGTVVGFSALATLSPEVYALSAAMAIFCTVIPSYIMNEAIKQIGAAKVSIIGSVGPISTIALAVIFLDEIITAWLLAGSVLVIAGVLLVGKYKQTTPNPNK